MNTTHTASDSPLTLPAIHDAASIQQALSAVIQGVAAGTLDTARAKLLLAGLKLAVANLRILSAAKQQAAPHRKQNATHKKPATTPQQEDTAQRHEARNAQPHDGGEICNEISPAPGSYNAEITLPPMCFSHRDASSSDAIMDMIPPHLR